MENVIETDKLGMQFITDWGGVKRALEDLNLQVPKNTIFGFLGHNGAGKTTTIKILVGICRATEGTAKILGIPIDNIESRKNIGFLPENPYFYEYLTAQESLEFYGSLNDISRKELRQKIPKLLDEVGLSHAINTQVKDFSKGMKQRLGLAQTMIHDPQLYILDEPLSGLDPVGRREVRGKILDLKKQGKTIFFSSHVLADVEMLCDEVALLVQGKMKAKGAIDSLIERNVVDVELVVEGYTEEGLKLVKEITSDIIKQDKSVVVRTKTEEQAQQAKQILEQHGGTLKALIPHKEGLEEYYIKKSQGESK